MEATLVGLSSLRGEMGPKDLYRRNYKRDDDRTAVESNTSLVVGETHKNF